MRIDNNGNFCFDSDEAARDHAQAAVDILEHSPKLAEGTGLFSCPEASWQRVMDAGSLVYGADMELVIASTMGRADRMFCMLNIAAHLLASSATHFKVCAPAMTAETAWRPSLLGPDYE